MALGSSQAALSAQGDPLSDKAELVAAIVEDAGLDPAACPEVVATCHAAIERKALQALPELAGLVREMFDRRLGIAEATIHLAAAKDGEHEEHERAWLAAKPGIISALRERSGRPEIRLIVKTDPALISGARVHLGDEVVELSARLGVENFRKSLRP